MIITNNKTCNIAINDKTILTLSAKEMFEELGYEYYEDDGFECYKKEKRELIEPDYVSFNRLEREVFMSNDSKNGNGVTVDMKLLQAINKQIEELHWNDTIINFDVKLDGKKVMEAMRGGNNA